MESTEGVYMVNDEWERERIERCGNAPMTNGVYRHTVNVNPAFNPPQRDDPRPEPRRHPGAQSPPSRLESRSAVVGRDGIAWIIDGTGANVRMLEENALDVNRQGEYFHVRYRRRGQGPVVTAIYTIQGTKIREH